MPRARAASASACAKLPELCAATPRCAAAASSDSTALHAPRNLKEPLFWYCSHLKKSERPASASSVPQRAIGVRFARPATRAAAARTAARSAA